MNITHNHNGIEISEIINDSRYHKFYIGYSEKEAIKLFKQEIKERIKQCKDGIS